MVSMLSKSVLSGLSVVRPCLKNVVTRGTSVVLSRKLATESAKPSGEAIATDEEQATGLEKLEYDALLAGNEDPFRLKMAMGPPGTAAKPTKVPSSFDERIVGCVCEEDATGINWMLLKEGPPKRCDCGHFFVLVPEKTIDI